MQVITQFNAFTPNQNRPLVLTLGTFDGVHQGHQRVLKRVCERARKTGGLAGVLTFVEHPMHVLERKEPPYLITSTQHRLRLLDQLGFDLCFLVRFDRPFSRQSPEDFVKNILVDRLKVTEVVLGYDSRFGKNREGTPEAMARLAKKFGFRSTQAGPRFYENRPISSTMIRFLIGEGDFTRVRRCLGRPYSILGDVVKGKGIGKRLGFPTANLNPHSEALPPRGVYLVKLNIVKVEMRRTPAPHRYFLKDAVLKEGLWGLLNIGIRPTLYSQSKSLVSEIHIFNFKDHLYGKTLEVTFKKRVRDEKRFESMDALKKQIKRDICSVDKYLHQKGLR